MIVRVILRWLKLEAAEATSDALVFFAVCGASVLLALNAFLFILAFFWVKCLDSLIHPEDGIIFILIDYAGIFLNGFVWASVKQFGTWLIRLISTQWYHLEALWTLVLSWLLDYLICFDWTLVYLFGTFGLCSFYKSWAYFGGVLSHWI